MRARVDAREWIRRRVSAEPVDYSRRAPALKRELVGVSALDVRGRGSEGALFRAARARVARSRAAVGVARRWRPPRASPLAPPPRDGARADLRRRVRRRRPPRPRAPRRPRRGGGGGGALAAGWDPLEPDAAGAVPMHYAAARGHLDVVDALVRATLEMERDEMALDASNAAAAADDAIRPGAPPSSTPRTRTARRPCTPPSRRAARRSRAASSPRAPTPDAGSLPIGPRFSTSPPRATAQTPRASCSPSPLGTIRTSTSTSTTRSTPWIASGAPPRASPRRRARLWSSASSRTPARPSPRRTSVSRRSADTSRRRAR